MTIMRYRGLALPALVAWALAGCSKAPEENRAPADTEAPAPAAATASAPAPSASPATLPGEIPVAMRGRWGLVPADCTSTRGDAKGLVTIDAKTLKFYESLATLKTVKAADDDDLTATFAFTGEGQTWTLDLALEVEDGGKTLIRKDTGPDALPGPLQYARCA